MDTFHGSILSLGTPRDGGAFTIPFTDGDFEPISGLSYRARDSIQRIYERLEMERKTDLHDGSRILIQVPMIKHLLK